MTLKLSLYLFRHGAVKKSRLVDLEIIFDKCSKLFLVWNVEAEIQILMVFNISLEGIVLRHKCGTFDLQIAFAVQG